ncbi:hypothetical protein Bca52824_034961 [Brassica carinata]|uniref:Uncharacterized protein n=1 Tax=Brassica carinata TaxID=52824 RepID=A0A8X7S0Z4_BRACI|nr:hypothetical protein Bca52824_034961 [Brassica carinata]
MKYNISSCNNHQIQPLKNQSHLLQATVLRDEVLKIIPVKNGDCVGNDDVEGGEGEATASSRTSIDGRETSKEATVKEDGCSGK